jgi:hypothetical protein
MLFDLCLSGKRNKIKRDIIENDYAAGGLKVPHFLSFCKAWKMSWIHKLINPLYMSPWKTLQM